MDAARNSGSTRLSTILNAALMVGAVAATVIAVGIVIALFSWLHGLPSKESQVASPRSLPPQPARPAPAAAPAAPVAAAAPQAPAPAPARHRPDRPQAPAGQAEPAVPPLTSERPMHASDPDVGINRSVARALSDLAGNPEARRKLGVPADVPP